MTTSVSDSPYDLEVKMQGQIYIESDFMTHVMRTSVTNFDGGYLYLKSILFDRMAAYGVLITMKLLRSQV